MINHDHFQDDSDTEHFSSNATNPLRNDAFDLADDQKIERIKKDVENILLTLGMDLTDDSLKGTPNRVAKMFVKEIFGGLNPNRTQSQTSNCNSGFGKSPDRSLRLDSRRKLKNVSLLET
jgi:GTP cyclohydrolase I